MQVHPRLDGVLHGSWGCASREARTGPHRLLNLDAEFERRFVTKCHVALEIYINEKFKTFSFLLDNIQLLSSKNR